MEQLDGVLMVRRSIWIPATPARVWHELESFERMQQWWGVVIGTPEAGKGNGQRLIQYEPRVGGQIVMEVEWDGEPVRYGGSILVYSPGRELTFDDDWIPNRGWQAPTFVSLRFSSALGGALVELFHHGFERTGASAGLEHAGYETGWGMTQLLALRRVIEATP